MEFPERKVLERNIRTFMNSAFEKLYEIPLRDDYDHEMQLFLKHLVGTRVLDVGCGFSRYGQYFRQAGLSYTGIELSEKMIAKGRQLWPEFLYTQMSYSNLGFRDESFDGIWAMCSLQHAAKRDLPLSLRELSRVLVPGGCLFALLPLTEMSYEEMVETPEGSFFHADWIPEEFEEELQSVDFELLESEIQYESGSSLFVARKKTNPA